MYAPIREYGANLKRGIDSIANKRPKKNCVITLQPKIVSEKLFYRLFKADI